ncbi:prepilin peptidase, partial [Paracraurococcus lichenis]
AAALLGPGLARLAHAQVATLEAQEASGRSGSELVESLRRLARPAGRPEPAWRLAHSAALALALAGGPLAAGPGLPGLFLALVAGLITYGALLDLRAYWLPDSITQPLLWLGLTGAALGLAPVPPADALLGAAAAWGLLAALQLGARALLGQAALGGGDVKLMAACGALVGFSGLPRLLVLLAAATALLALAWRQARRPGPDWIPLGLAISAAALAATTLTATGQ